MVVHASYPVYYTPSSTNSGIVNSYGPIIHGPTVSGFEGPFSCDARGVYLPINLPLPIVNSNLIMVGPNIGFSILPQTQVVFMPGLQYIEAEIDNTLALDSMTLGFSYFIYPKQGIYKGVLNLVSKLNIISIEDLQVQIEGKLNLGFKDFYGIITASFRNSTNLEVEIIGELPHVELSAHIITTVAYKILQLFTKGEYIYVAANRGTDIFGINTGTSTYFKESLDIRVSTIWGNDTTLYIGGSTGLFEIKYNDLHNDYENSILKPSFQLTTPVTYIHGKENKLLVCTISGIEYINYTSNPTIKSKTNIANVSRCFMTKSKAYYTTHNTVSGIVVAAIHRKDNLITDWVEPSHSYIAGEGILLTDLYLTDIFITEETAAYGGNTILCTTTSGVYIIDEDTKEYAIYYTEQQ